MESLTLEEFFFVEKIHHKSNKKSFDSTKNRYIQIFEDDLMNRNKGRRNANIITVKKKWVINMCLRQLSQFLRGVKFWITSKTLSNKVIIATIEDAVRDLLKHDCCQSKPYTSKLKPTKDNFFKNNLERITIWYISCNFYS